MAACQDNGDSSNEIPQWKRELILRRRAVAKSLPAGSSSVQFTCPSVVAAVRLADSASAAGGDTSSATHTSVDAAAEELDNSLLVCGGRATAAAAVGSVGENMRLVEDESAPGNRRPLKNGVSFDANNSVDAVMYRSIMGEEKSGKKACGTRKMDTNSAAKGVNLVLGENNNGGYPHQEDCLSDSSEELQYGPGIVKKLKSKYMSMTLRESKNKGVRPSLSQLRRATSLENMIDNDGGCSETGKPQLIMPPPQQQQQQPQQPPHKFTKRTEAIGSKSSGYAGQHQARYRSAARGNDSIKRARSVEALLRYDAKPPPIEKKLLLKSLSRDELVIFDKNGAVINAVVGDEKPPVPTQSSSSLTRKKRPVMTSHKHGLPPADLVKQTLKIFEKSATATAAPSTPPTMAKLNIAAANQHKPTSNKPQLSPKPSPEKIRRNPMGMLQSPKKAAAAPSTPVAEVQPPPQLVAAAEDKRVPPVPSRVLPLDLTPEPSSLSVSSPRSKSPSPLGHITVKTILTPVNAGPKTPPFVKPRTPSPGPLSPTASETHLRSPSPVKAPKLPSPLVQPLTPTYTAPKLPSPIVPPLTPTYTAPKLPSPTVPPLTSTYTAPKLPSPTVPPLTPTYTAPKLPSPVAQPQTPPVLSPKSPSPVFKPLRPTSPGLITARTPSPTSRPGPTSAAPVANGKPPTPDGNSSDEDAADGVATKKISRASLENIRKGGSTVEFTFNNNTKTAPRPTPLPATSAPSPAARQPTPMSPLPSIKSPDALTNKKQVGVIRPIVNKFMQPPSSLTDREIEKNQINRVRSNPTEQPTKVVVSVKPSEIVVGNVSDSLGLKNRANDAKSGGGGGVVKSGAVKSNGPGLWDNKWNQQNTMIFDFRNTAGAVPDYIENDGIIRPRGKREKIKAGESGFIVLDPSLEESSTDGETDDFNCSLGPPSPCNVHFEGGNILINGKSSLRKHPKQRKLRITFNDNATQRFEYPSESSLLNDMLNSASCSGGGGGGGGLPTPTPSGPTPGLPVPSGGSSLASYTSRVSQGAEDFQLGVSRTTPQPKPREAEGTAEAAAGAATNGEAESVAWSADTAADLLF